MWMCFTYAKKSILASVGFIGKRNVAYKWYRTLCFRWLCLNPLLITGHVTSGRQKKNNPHHVECQSGCLWVPPAVLNDSHICQVCSITATGKYQYRLCSRANALSKILSILLTDELRILMSKVLNMFLLCQISESHREAQGSSNWKE